MKIFLTGATGFLGSHVVDVLLDRGHELKALVRPTSFIRRLKEQGVKLIQGQIPQSIPLSETLSECDAVVHMAGAIKALNKKEFFRINAQGTAYLVEQILKAQPKPRILVHVSSVTAVDPRRGDDFCLPAELAPALSHYGESKRQGELALGPLKGKVQTIILRPPVLYGPRDVEFISLFRMIGRGLAPMYRGGKNQLSVCYGPDTARAVANLIENPPPGDGIFCLDDGMIHSWKSLATTIARVMGKRPRFLPLRDPMMYSTAFVKQIWAQLRRRPEIFTLNKMREMRQPRWVCGYSELQKATGWKPTTPIETGMGETYQFYRREGLV
jgi:nucleoside-diphosphate-sugar epimerase